MSSPRLPKASQCFDGPHSARLFSAGLCVHGLFSGGSLCRTGPCAEGCGKGDDGVSAGMVLGVPVVSAIAGAASLRAAMLFWRRPMECPCWPSSFPARTACCGRVTYCSQVRVLKRSASGCRFWGGAAQRFHFRRVQLPFGVFGRCYRAAGPAGQRASAAYGLANILGNAIGAGRFPPVRCGLWCCSRLCWAQCTATPVGRKLPAPAVGAVLLWGILAGCAGNINQYWITAAAPEAPEFANGLFLSATNLGTTVGATLCGALIDSLGASSLPLGGLLMLAAGAVLLLLRARQCRKNPVFGKQEAQKAVS